MVFSSFFSEFCIREWRVTAQKKDVFHFRFRRLRKDRTGAQSTPAASVLQFKSRIPQLLLRFHIGIHWACPRSAAVLRIFFYGIPVAAPGKLAPTAFRRQRQTRLRTLPCRPMRRLCTMNNHLCLCSCIRIHFDLWTHGRSSLLAAVDQESKSNLCSCSSAHLLTHIPDCPSSTFPAFSALQNL